MIERIELSCRWTSKNANLMVKQESLSHCRNKYLCLKTFLMLKKSDKVMVEDGNAIMTKNWILSRKKSWRKISRENDNTYCNVINLLMNHADIVSFNNIRV